MSHTRPSPICAVEWPTAGARVVRRAHEKWYYPSISLHLCEHKFLYSRALLSIFVYMWHTPMRSWKTSELWPSFSWSVPGTAAVARWVLEWPGDIFMSRSHKDIWTCVCTHKTQLNDPTISLFVGSSHDTCACSLLTLLLIHPLKQKRFACKQVSPSWLKQKQEQEKAHFTSFTPVSVANCLSITLRQTIPLLETVTFPYQFYRPCLSRYHRSPDIATPRRTCNNRYKCDNHRWVILVVIYSDLIIIVDSLIFLFFKNRCEYLNELVIVRIRNNVSASFQKFLFSCCKIEFVQVKIRESSTVRGGMKWWLWWNEMMSAKGGEKKGKKEKKK